MEMNAGTATKAFYLLGVSLGQSRCFRFRDWNLPANWLVAGPENTFSSSDT